MVDQVAEQGEILLEVNNLCKNYKKVQAIKDINFHVRKGEIFGLLGPDGAGKSTIMNIFTGLLSPNKGSVKFFGIDVIKDPNNIKTSIGYMPQGLGVILTPELSVDENMEYFADMHQVSRIERKKTKKTLFGRLYLHPFVDRLSKNLSGGMKQKLALCCTLIHKPKVIILDEPTTGVDPVSRREFWITINELVVEDNMTVILSTSYMDEAERCHRVALMHEGHIVSMGTVEELKETLNGRMYEFAGTPQQQAIKILKNSGRYESVQPFGERINIVTKPDGPTEVKTILEENGVKVEEFQPIEPALENVFTSFLESTQKDSKEEDVESLFQGIHVWTKDTGYTYSVEVENLLKEFGKFKAVNNVNFKINKGEIFGFLGPNGAGKTTTIKILCGLYPPSGGKGSVAGFDIVKQNYNIRQKIGYMSQKFSLYQDLTIAENMQLYAGIYGVPRKDLKERMEWILKLAALEGMGNVLTRDIPMGIRQKLSLGTSLLHHPDIVFLDEPTSGVDPLSRRRFWDIIHEISRTMGVSVMVSTHYMDEAEHCDRVSLMHRGYLIAVGSPAEMKKDVAEKTGHLMELKCSDPMRGFLELRKGFPDVNIFGKKLLFYTKKPEEDTKKASDILQQGGIQTVSCNEKRIMFEDVFMYYIENSGIE